MNKIVFFLLFVPSLLSGQVLTKDELLGHFDPASHHDFVKIEKEYTAKKNIYLRRETYEAFKRMSAAAKQDGISLVIISATRNFDYQKRIWEKKWAAEKYANWTPADKAREIMHYSSMPGTSRHHWGTDMDFNSLEPSWFRSGNGKKLYDWLVRNGSDYGFFQTYTPKVGGRTGYEEEAWHWTYLPLSKKMLDEYNRQIRNIDITGFNGCEVVSELRVIEWYVNGVDERVRQ
ncbi:MAG: M15 family metallopeptidase [Crocinitomicaceae bacterium]|nr:M15 family metallopeptidase [Crocinitomicaceae bacterium]